MRNFFKNVYFSSVEGTKRRGRPLGRWEDRIRKYASERGVKDNALDWTRRPVCRGHPFGGGFRWVQGVRDID